MYAGTMTVSRVEVLLAEIQAGRLEARGELLHAACDRLIAITRTLKRSFPQVGRWEQTEDVFQNASLRLYEALADVEIADPLHFFRLAALQIRRELIDMSRRYNGPLGIGQNHYTQRADAATSERRAFEGIETTYDPQAVAQWAEFHELIDRLADDERAVTELLWYHGMSQEEAADLLGVDVRTVRRRWRSARLSLHDALQGELPSV